MKSTSMLGTGTDGGSGTWWIFFGLAVIFAIRGTIGDQGLLLPRNRAPDRPGFITAICEHEAIEVSVSVADGRPSLCADDYVFNSELELNSVNERASRQLSGCDFDLASEVKPGSPIMGEPRSRRNDSGNRRGPARSSSAIERSVTSIGRAELAHRSVNWIFQNVGESPA